MEDYDLNEMFMNQAGAFSQAHRFMMELLVKLHKDFNNEKYSDWPSVILATQLGTLGGSLLSILPRPEESEQLVDMRSIASLVRNVVDTHDVLDMLLNEQEPKKFQLHRDLLGYYISGRFKEVQKKISPEKAEDFYKYANVNYWERIRKSPFYNKKIERLKGGEGIFYQSRKERVQKVFQKNYPFVQAILADISTYVHALPPTNFFSSLDDQCKNTQRNMELISVWLQVLNTYYAHCIQLILNATGYKAEGIIDKYLSVHKAAFQ